MSTDFFGGSIFGGGFFAPAVIQVIDTHDGANKHYRKRAAERAKIREEIERLFDGRPLVVEHLEQYIASSPEPVSAFSAERIEQMIRALEELEREREDEEIVLMAIQ